jgi:DNA-binding beta-propeller fold protein YncE
MPVRVREFLVARPFRAALVRLAPRAMATLPSLVCAVVLIGAQGAKTPEYLVYVASEAADKIALVRLAPGAGRIDHEFTTGIMPADIDGPHGLAVSPDRRFYYVSLAHGQPYGTVWKYSTKDDSAIGRVTLGMFPATLETTPDGEFLYVVNFNLHGDMVRSSVSVVATGEMLEIARIPTCTMPHGSRLNPQGTRQYSACMMDDTLVEIDTSTLKPTRYFVVTKSAEGGYSGSPALARRSQPSGEAHTSHDGPEGQGGVGQGIDPPKVSSNACSPTWAQPSSDGTSIFVACNGSNEIVEIDAKAWSLKRRISAGNGVYNLAVTKNERLVATNRRDQSVSVFDTRAGRELVRLTTRRRIVHGIVVSPDDRYAFVSVEGIGMEPGTVEMIDLQALKIVARVDVAPQAGGIDFYKIDR